MTALAVVLAMKALHKKYFGVRRPAAEKLALVVAFGLLLGWGVVYGRSHWPVIGAKLRGDAPSCPWSKVLTVRRDNTIFDGLRRELQADVAALRQDNSNGAELLTSPQRAFWIPRGDGQAMSGVDLLAYLLAEHMMLGATNPGDMVRPGDTVIDCGAHVGVFTYFALRRGASKVVAVEPDPVNRECFRRNFEREIASGQVVLVGKAAWSSATTLRLSESSVNSGGSSVVSQEGSRSVEVVTTTIDTIVRDCSLPRVDYIKLDIEGAEREALKGARDTLRKSRPRLMLDAYHRPDDPAVLADLILQAYSGYQAVCGPCELISRRLIPHAIFFHP